MTSSRILSLLVVLISLQCHGLVSSLPHPHIVFIVADDLGWNDVGYHNPDIISPNVDHLAFTGTILNHSYVQPVCSPSRSAFMTSYYPFRMGLQHMVIGGGQQVCVPLDKTLLPQVFKKYGYNTHMIGKWHLGFCKWECTPTYRGFDTFDGYYNAMEDFYTKEVGSGFDFRKNEAANWGAAGNYSAYQYADRAYDLILSHNKDRPFFLYLALQNVHSPMEVPDYYYNLYPHIANEGRRTFSGMVTAMDDAIGKVVNALKKTGMYEDTIIFFSSDNGGSIEYSGNNYPLRGAKMTIWEGGTRVPAFVHSPKYVKRGVQYNGMMHAVDWFPTIVEAANMKHEDADRDGVSQWQAITSLRESPRMEFVYNMDNHSNPTEGEAAIRVGDYKLIEGYPGSHSDWYLPNLTWTGYMPRADLSDSDLIYKMMERNWTNFKGLFNLAADPHERVNLYFERPLIVRRLKQRLEFYKKIMLPPNYPSNDPASDPSNFNGTWSPGWC